MLDKHQEEKQLKAVLEQAELLTKQNKFTEANALYNQAMEIYKAAGNNQDRADLLYQMGLNLSANGQLEEARQLWSQSINLFEQLGDIFARASIIHNIGTVLAQQGEISEAVKFWQQSLGLKETIDDPLGKAATLINLAWAANQQGNNLEEYNLNIESAKLLAKNNIWPELLKVLINLAKSAENNSQQFLAQALWLAVYTETDADTIFFVTSDLLKKIGLENEIAPVIASTGVIVTDLRSLEITTGQQEIRQASREILAACALVRNIPVEEISDWIQKQGLNDDIKIYHLFDQVINHIVGEENWLFERNSLPVL